MSEETLLYLTPIGIIFVFAIKAFFDWLKSKNGNTCITQIKNEMSEMKINLVLINQKLENHIEHISQNLIQINANLKQNTKDTNEVQKDIIIIKEKLK